MDMARNQRFVHCFISVGVKQTSGYTIPALCVFGGILYFKRDTSHYIFNIVVDFSKNTSWFNPFRGQIVGDPGKVWI